MRSKVVVFGAGASFGSDTSETPPLGCNLFDQLAAFDTRGWGSLPNNLANIFRGDFEEGMKQVWQHNAYIVPVLQRMMAEFFFNFVPRDTNLYVSFARSLKNDPSSVSLVTFNYERLLELSLSHCGLQPVCNTPTLASNQVEVVFPHGCCHFFGRGVRGGGTGGVYFTAGAVTTTGTPDVVADRQEFLQRLQQDAIPPVMSYFEPDKRTTACVDFIERQRKRYADVIQAAEIVAIVGLKVRPHDNHIWDPLKSTTARLLYCSGISAGDEFRRWTSQSRPSCKDKILLGYFRESLGELCAELGL